MYIYIEIMRFTHDRCAQAFPFNFHEIFSELLTMSLFNHAQNALIQGDISATHVNGDQLIHHAGATIAGDQHILGGQHIHQAAQLYPKDGCYLSFILKYL